MALHDSYNYLTVKQGDSFNYSGPILNEINDVEQISFEGWNGSAELRTDSRELIAELDFVWVNAENGILQIKNNSSTNEWPLGRALLDIELITPSGDVISTETIVILIELDVTNTRGE